MELSNVAERIAETEWINAYFSRGGEKQDYIIKNNGECEVLPAPFAVFLNKDDKNYVEPDISVICDKDKITDKGCNGVPDWIIEVISPVIKRWTISKNYFSIKLLKFGSIGLLIR